MRGDRSLIYTPSRARYANETALLAELDKLVLHTDFSPEIAEALLSGDLARPPIIALCDAGVDLLRSKTSSNIHRSLHEMDIVKKRVKTFRAITETFSQRFTQYFINLIGDQAERNVDDAARHRVLEQYARMAQWLHEVEPESNFSQYAGVTETYGQALNVICCRHTAELCQNASTRANVGTKAKQPSVVLPDLSARLFFDEVFDQTLSALLKYYTAEHKVARRIFVRDPELALFPSATKPADVSNNDGASTDRTIYSEESAVEPGGIAVPAAVINQISTPRNPAVDTMLSQMFVGIEASILKFIDIGARADQWHWVAMYTRLSARCSAIESGCDSIITATTPCQHSSFKRSPATSSNLEH